jgi:hypothetical protein
MPEQGGSRYIYRLVVYDLKLFEYSGTRRQLHNKELICEVEAQMKQILLTGYQRPKDSNTLFGQYT